MKEWSKRLNETKMINLKGGDAQQGEDYFVQSVGPVSDCTPATRKVRTTKRTASNNQNRPSGLPEFSVSGGERPPGHCVPRHTLHDREVLVHVVLPSCMREKYTHYGL